VIGTGISGIAAGVQLQRLGIPYTIYERRSEVGGTWSINTYPDARVDTTNFMYQFGFEKNYPWTEYFARQDEVWRYLSHVAEKYGLLPNIRFGADVTSAVFDEMTASWRLMVSDDEGRTEAIEANAIISGSGLFGTPRELEIDGVEGFRGSIIHTTQWDGDQDIDGKRVAVIGNGSTGVQLLGAIAERAEHVTVFQRTPQWISGRDRYGEQLSPETRWLLDTMPYYWNWYIYSILAEANGSQVLQEPDSEWQAQGGLVSEANDNFRALLTEYIRSNLPGRPDLVKKVTPHHAPMARRLIVDNGWYTALLRDNVELVTEGIEGLTPDSVRTVDGVERPIDVIVAAVGFSTTKYLHPTEYRGVGGTTLEQRWSESQGPRAHLGIAVPGFPNLFIMYGPNSQPRSGSLVSFVEAWAAYAAKSIVVMLERGHRRMEVRQEVFDDYNARLDKHSLELIWMDPGSLNRNYYVNEHGRSQVNEPWRVEQYYSWVIEPDPDEFDFV
jgi:4-hydroxyacetophenone monooxygenase